MTVYILTKGYTVPGNQGTHDKLNQVQKFYQKVNLVIHFYLDMQGFQCDQNKNSNHHVMWYLL